MLYDSRRSKFLQYAVCQTPEMVKIETGFAADTLDYVWDKYEHALPKRQRDPQLREMYFYFVFRWIHMYPTWEQAPVVLWTAALVTQKGCGISPSTLRDVVLIYLVALSVAINEVHWEDRLDQFNHTELLQTRFTAMLDTAPLVISEPIGSISRFTFQPKYKKSCFKIQVLACMTRRCLYSTDCY